MISNSMKKVDFPWRKNYTSVYITTKRKFVRLSEGSKS